MATSTIRDRVYSVATRTGGRRETVLHPLQAGDGVQVSLSNLQRRDDALGAVLLIHGLTTSSDMYVMPEHYGLAAYLYDEGYDVWLADFRMSSHFSHNIEQKFNMDDVALYDWPVMVEYIRKHTTAEHLHVVAHCLGSVTFSQALYGPTVEGIRSFVSNSVSLTPRVHSWARFKISVAPFLVELLLKKGFVDPNWEAYSRKEQPWVGRFLAKATSLVHLECNSQPCNLLSFIWGAGHPAMYCHENVHEATHARLTELFGPVGMEYFRNVRAGLSRGAFGRYGKGAKYDSLPDQYLDNVGRVQVPTLLLSGDCNNIFPGANRLTYERIQARGIPGYEFRVLEGYGHQDAFMGRHSDRDVFPIVLDFLRANGN